MEPFDHLAEAQKMVVGHNAVFSPDRASAHALIDIALSLRALAQQSGAR